MAALTSDVAASVDGAQKAIAHALQLAHLRGDPMGAVLEAISLSLGAQADLHAAATVEREVPMDDKLRDRIVDAVERQVRKEAVSRLNMARPPNPNARQNLVVVCASIALLTLATGAGLFSAGWSYGGDARIAELCQGDAVREQGGGRTCAFWLVQRPKQEQRPAPKG